MLFYNSQMANEDKKQTELMRIMGTDIRTNMTLAYGLAQIKGIGFMFANAICTALKLEKTRTIGDLSEKEVEQLETYLTSPEKKGIPSWMLNQRKDDETGKDVHFVSKDIEFNLLQLKRNLAKLKTYKGLRHRARLPLRGQRTKSNFRRNKTLAAMKSKRGGNK